MLGRAAHACRAPLRYSGKIGLASSDVIAVMSKTAFRLSPVSGASVSDIELIADLQRIGKL